MNQRYQNSLINDPNLNIQISLTGILFLNNQIETPWTNATYRVDGIPIYKNKNTLVCNDAVSAFASAMSSRIYTNLTYDHAAAVVKYTFSFLFIF